MKIKKERKRKGKERKIGKRKNHNKIPHFFCTCKYIQCTLI